MCTYNLIILLNVGVYCVFLYIGLLLLKFLSNNIHVGLCLQVYYLLNGLYEIGNSLSHV